jgi:hypothetical protein
MITISVRQDTSGIGWRRYAGLSCYELPYLSDYSGPLPTRAAACRAARAERRAIMQHLKERD